nr:protein cutoff isoform X2 [Drosophila bipectinata]
MNPTILTNIDAHSFPEEDKKTFPNVTSPKCIGSYSISPFGSFENNNDRMRYIAIPPPKRFPLPLRNQERQVVPIKPPQETIDNTLLFIESMRSSLLKVVDMRVVVNAAFVCPKEVLELIMFAPFENKYGWTLGATRFRGTLYLCVLEKCEPDNFDQDNLERVMKANWIRNLRMQVLSDNGQRQPCSRDMSDENNRFNAAFTLTLNDQTIIFDSPVLAEIKPNQYH